MPAAASSASRRADGVLDPLGFLHGTPVGVDPSGGSRGSHAFLDLRTSGCARRIVKSATMRLTLGNPAAGFGFPTTRFGFTFGRSAARFRFPAAIIGTPNGCRSRWRSGSRTPPATADCTPLELELELRRCYDRRRFRRSRHLRQNCHLHRRLHGHPPPRLTPARAAASTTAGTTTTAVTALGVRGRNIDQAHSQRYRQGRHSHDGQNGDPPLLSNPGSHPILLQNIDFQADDLIAAQAQVALGPLAADLNASEGA